MNNKIWLVLFALWVAVLLYLDNKIKKQNAEKLIHIHANAMFRVLCNMRDVRKMNKKWYQFWI